MYPPGTPLVWSIGESVGTVNERESDIEFRANGTIYQIVSDSPPTIGFARDERERELAQSGNFVRRERYLYLEPTQNGWRTNPFPLIPLPTDLPKK